MDQTDHMQPKANHIHTLETGFNLIKSDHSNIFKYKETKHWLLFTYKQRKHLLKNCQNLETQKNLHT